MSNLGISRTMSQWLYDTVQLAAAADQTAYFFVVPFGQLLTATVRKGYQHTNLKQACQLEADNHFHCTGISMHCREIAQGGNPVKYADQQAIHCGYMVFGIGDGPFHYIPNCAIPAGGCELNYFSNITAAATEFHVNRGVNALSNCYALDEPLDIEPGAAIKCEVFIPGTPSQVTDLMVMLRGTWTKPVR